MNLFKRKPKIPPHGHVYKDIEEIYLRRRYCVGDAMKVYYAAKQECIVCGCITWDEYYDIRPRETEN